MKNILINFLVWYIKNEHKHNEKTVERLIQTYLDERNNKRND
jgi:hypothetical protein